MPKQQDQELLGFSFQIERRGLPYSCKKTLLAVRLSRNMIEMRTSKKIHNRFARSAAARALHAPTTARAHECNARRQHADSRYA